MRQLRLAAWFTLALTLAVLAYGQAGKSGSGVPVPIAGAKTAISAALTTTAAASDALSMAGVTASSRCVLAATNASAATNIATTYISAKSPNQVTVTHTATASMTYDILCTPN